jgi:peptidoglycan/LPS O-acetylase OafA/YrhL
MITVNNRKNGNLSRAQPVNASIPNIQPSKTRLRNIDALRGICAILVVLHHIAPHSWEGAGIWTSHPIFSLDLGRIGVAAFFLISGYVIPFSVPSDGKRVLKFWIARFFRLWPAYWVAILVTLIMGASEIPLNLKNIAFNVTMLQKFFGIQDMVSPFWTLQIELIFYALITIMVAFGVVSNKRYYRLGFYVMIGLSLAMSAFRGSLHIRLPVVVPMALTLMFLAGYIRNCRLMSKPIPRIMLACYVVSLIPICWLGYSENLSGSDDPYKWMLAYSAALCLFLLFESTADAPSVAVFMGRISYSVYLLFPAVIKVDQILLGSKNTIFDVGFTLALTTAFAWVVYRLVELPSQRWGKIIIKRIQDPVS